MRDALRSSLASLLVLTLLAQSTACRTAIDGASAGLQAQLIGSPPYAEGDTITIEGRALGSAIVRVNAVEVDPLQRDSRRLRFVLNARLLPSCTGTPLSVRVEVTTPVASRAMELQTLGAAPVVLPPPGGSIVLADWGSSGCGAVLPPNADFDIAITRTVDPADDVTALDVRARLPYTIDATPVERYEVATHNATAVEPQLRFARARGRFAAHASARASRRSRPTSVPARINRGCNAAPSLGDSIQLIQTPFAPSSTTEPTAWYALASSSPHIGVLVRQSALESLPAAQRALVPSLADTLEVSAAAFLRRAFRPWPDVDDDPRLFVAYGPLAGVAGLGASPGARVDGCGIDLIWLSTSLPISPSTRPNGAAGVLVHEGAHWADASVAPLSSKPAWSVEGFAALAQQLWQEENAGIGFWAKDFAGPYCGEGCALLLLKEHRLGYPGLSAGESVNGASVLRYLVQQALAEGTSPLLGLDRLRGRHGVHRFSSSFEAAGGTGRSEAELATEFLLQFSRAGLSDGASRRIRHGTFDLAGAGWAIPELQSFPLQSFVIDGARSHSITLTLAHPDGMVGEAHSGERPLRITLRGTASVALGVARRP